MKKAIIFFTRVPVAGQTKTRLMPYLSGEECAELHKSFIKKIYKTCLSTEIDIILDYTPEEKGYILESIIPEHFKGEDKILIQEGETLGIRMEKAFEAAFEKGYEEVVLIGSDIPQISKDILMSSFELLKKNHVVINPTYDGGYYLIGMKQNYPEIWTIKNYGVDTVFNETKKQIEALNLKVASGPMCRDVDTKEDLEYYRSLGADPSECIHCGKCTKSCEFLKKYQLVLNGFAKRPDLAYSCFLCGKCRTVCPKDIDGRSIAIGHRMTKVHQDADKAAAGYKSILMEKNPYIFANYKKGKKKSVLFPGCNFTAFYPKTTKYLEKLMSKYDIGIVYECCQKPVYELGFADDSNNNLKRIEEELKKEGVEEIVTLCPNCYHFMKDKIDISVVSIYKKLLELGEGQQITKDKLSVYYPCPESQSKEIFEDIKAFLSDDFQEDFENVQCCGLGGCASVREPELASKMVEKAKDQDKELYTYCASCISNFRRKGLEKSYHILPLILGVEEKVPLNFMSLVNRAKRKFL